MATGTTRVAWCNVKAALLDSERLWLMEQAKAVPATGAVLEIGSWLGGSMGCFLAGLPAGAGLFSIDLYPDDLLVNQKASLAEFGVIHDRVVRLKGGSQELLGTWKRYVDVLFIDGDHHELAALADLVGYTPWCTGVVAVHDAAMPDESEMPDRGRRMAIAGLVGPVSSAIEEWLLMQPGEWQEFPAAGSIRAFRRINHDRSSARGKGVADGADGETARGCHCAGDRHISGRLCYCPAQRAE